MDYYRKSVSEILKTFSTSKEGLCQKEAQARLQKFGLNALEENSRSGKWGVLISQIRSPLVFVLLAASFVTLLLGEIIDTSAILAAVVLNVLVGFFQEYKAENEIESLKKLLLPKAYVLRDGKKTKIDAKEVVVGDIIYLKAGTFVPADARIISKNTTLRVNEASLTGESQLVSKTYATLGKKAAIGDRKNMVYMGTQVVVGSALAVVVATGLDTQLGKISKGLSGIKNDATPLQKKLSDVSRKLAIMVFLISAGIFTIGVVVEGNPLEMFTTSVAIAVSAIPEGLLIALTVILALGMRRMYKRKALIRRMVSAETLGSVTHICTDKTGTLTYGRMEVSDWRLFDEELSLKCMVLCNDFGNGTDRALWNKAKSVKHFSPSRTRDRIKRLAVIPFSSTSKFMATLHNTADIFEREVRKDTLFLFAKGAPEEILSMCKLPRDQRTELKNLIEKWAEDGQRVLALSYKKFSPKGTASFKSQIEAGYHSGQSLLGLIALSDPVRKEAKGALEYAKKHGIKVSVVTGDYRETAISVMNKLGINVRPSETLDGSDLESMRDEDLYDRVRGIKLFSRVTPSDKLRIVEALQEHGEVVAMTGDGVNDALALKKADIGIVVGNATDIAKGTADLVLLDSNFATIISAIKEGRRIFERIKIIILYLLSDSFSEVVLVSGSIVAGLPLPILASQILWVNLINDTFPALALTEEKNTDLPKVRQNRASRELIDGEIKILIFLVSVIAGLSSLYIFKAIYASSGDIVLARSAVFTLIGMDSLLYVYSCRSLRVPIWKTKIFSNSYLNVAVISGIILQVSALYIPILQKVLRVKPLTFTEWVYILLAAFGEIIAIEAVKHVWAAIDEKKNLRRAYNERR